MTMRNHVKCTLLLTMALVVVVTAFFVTTLSFHPQQQQQKESDNLGDSSLVQQHVFNTTSRRQLFTTPLSIQSARASSIEDSGFSANFAMDGNLQTRWSSQRTDKEWIVFELTQTSPINSIQIAWETAFGLQYEIQTSLNDVHYKTVFSQTNGKGQLETVSFPTTSAKYIRLWGVTRGTQYGYSIYEFRVHGFKMEHTPRPTPPPTTRPTPPPTAFRPLKILNAQASSMEQSDRGAKMAMDGNFQTRWSSQRTDKEWLVLELDGIHVISQVIIYWEEAYALQFEIQVSTSGNTWNRVLVQDNGRGGVERISLPPTTRGRFIRILGVERFTSYGYSIHEVEVFGGGNLDVNTPSPTRRKVVRPPTTLLTTPRPTRVTTRPTLRPTPTTKRPTLVPTIRPTVGPTRTPSLRIKLVNAIASSVSDSKFVAQNVMDGNLQTRWSSQYQNDEWLRVELDETHQIDKVVLVWEKAFGLQYKLEISTNGVNWNSIHVQNNGKGKTETIVLDKPVMGRFVRMLGIQRATKYGYSIFEVQVFGVAPPTTRPTRVPTRSPTILPFLGIPKLVRATASSVENSRNDRAANKAIDGNIQTRWSSSFSDKEWLTVELDGVYEVTKVAIDWEQAHALKYEIQVSIQGEIWSTVYRQELGQGKRETIVLERGVIGKFVKMVGIQRATAYGYSIYEVQVNPPNRPTPSPTPVNQLPDDCNIVDFENFNICVDAVSVGTYNRDWVPLVRAAQRRWEGFITRDASPAVSRADLKNQRVPTCNNLPNFVDDMYICARDEDIDGPGKRIGQARVTATHRISSLPIAGYMQFDTADLQNMLNSGSFEKLVAHEIGHIMGLGSYWKTRGLTRDRSDDSAVPDYEYTGRHGCDQWQRTTGCPDCPPIENDGGSGTAGVHWDEGIMKDEMMTGWLSRGGVSSPISAVSVGSLQDLGYSVDYSRADPFPPAGFTCPARRNLVEATNQRTVPKRNSSLFPELSPEGLRDARAYGKELLDRAKASRPSTVSSGLLYTADQQVSVIYEEKNEYFIIDVFAEEFED